MAKFLALVVVCAAIGCAAEPRLDPGALTLRDLLGLEPAVAQQWDADERAAARAIIETAAGERDSGDYRLPAAHGGAATAITIATLGALDHRRDRDGEPPLAWVRVQQRAGEVLVEAAPEEPEAPGAVVLAAWPDELVDLGLRDPDHLSLLARRAGADVDTIEVRPAPRAPLVAAWHVDEQVLLVNPVALAAREPASEVDAGVIAIGRRAVEPAGPPAIPAAERQQALIGNPYTFFGSVGECAAAQRQHCAACADGGDCDPLLRGSSSGVDDCQTLAADDGRGYHLLCANVALAIATVAACADERAPQCPAVTEASDRAELLSVNASFLDDPACAEALDGCLDELFGAPDEPFPGPPADAGPGAPDGGIPTAPEPRSTEVGCGDSSANCDFDPQCSSTCEGATCDSPDCNADCSNTSLDCGGCGGDGGGGGCDGCGSSSGDCGSSDSGQSSCDPSCGGDGSGGCDSGSCEGGGCDSGSCEGGGCDCGAESGGDCGSCSGGGGSSSCQVARRAHTRGALLALGWALLPLVVLERARRRARRSRPGSPAGDQP